jgi:glycosyltransferase involved in cell wall biosynthesis
MQELLNGLSSAQKATISSIEVVAFTCGDLNKMFPDFRCEKFFTEVSFPKLKPFLIKTIYYHLASLSHSMTKGQGRKKIGIGIACPNVDIVNVQFIHEQWKHYFLQSRKLSFISRIYKKILFFYFSIFEKYVYSFRVNVKFIVIANFLKTFLSQKFNTPENQMTIIPSGVNTEEFNLYGGDSDDLTKKLLLNYPQLKDISFAQPVALFVGAFERKGLGRALDALRKIPNAQLIVIGQSENTKFKMPELPYKVAHIPFTKEVSLFYQIADLFIFPTQYEPFGLVIIEAYVMGLDLIIPVENVGASEIIQQSEGINFFHQGEEIQLKSLKKIPLEVKRQRRNERLEKIKKYSWQASSEKFFQILSAD